MILEVKQFPESQEVMDDPEWFFIMDADPNDNKLGSSSYARILDKSEYILVEKTTADDCMITYRDPGDENGRNSVWFDIYNKRININSLNDNFMFLWD